MKTTTSKFLAALWLAAASALSADERPMNVVFILADDLGWADTSLYGHTSLYETPNIERLAKRGMTFTRAYAASPLCSPTRASILTGQTPARHGSTAPQHHLGEERLTAGLKDSAAPNNKVVIPESATRLDTAFPTLGKLIRAANHRTGHFGKWHLGPDPYSPLQHGFEVDLPHWPGPGPAGGFLAPWNYKTFEAKSDGEHIEDRMAEEAVAWMRTVKDEPFFLNYWQFSVHAPFDAKPDLIERYRGKIDPQNAQRSPTYAAMVHSMDDAVGTLLDAVDAMDLASRTIIILFSDNGGNMYNGIEETGADGGKFITTPTSNNPLRGGKATIYEGGIRVPCIVVWPGVTEPGSRSDALIQSTDFYPLLLAALGIDPPADWPLDGVDFQPALRGESFDRGPIFTYFPHSPGVPDWLPPSVAVHVGDWKLIRLFHHGPDGAHDYRLYNLQDDIGEQNDLAQSMPEKVRELDALIGEHLQSTAAIVPVVNPKFDPAKFDPAKIGVQAGGLKLDKRSRDARAAEDVDEAPPVQGETSAGDWQGKEGVVDLREEDGELVVSYAGEDPWIKTDPAGLPRTGTIIVEAEVLSSAPGVVTLFCAWGRKPFARGSGLDEAVPAGTWTTCRWEVPAPAILTTLRFDPPGKNGEMRIRKIRVLDAGGQTLANWF